MNVLVGFACSGVVAKAFRKRGHNAFECDIKPCEDPESARWHLHGSIFDYLDREWDLAIFHPECTYFTSSSVRWLTDHFVTKRDGPQEHEGKRGYWHDGAPRRALQAQHLAQLHRLNRESEHIPKTAIENPQGMLSSLWRPPDQYIQPWEHGHGEVKKTGLWLKNLPLIKPTNIVPGREARVWSLPPGPNRQADRSRTFQGIADAFAAQWG